MKIKQKTPYQLITTAYTGRDKVRLITDTPEAHHRHTPSSETQKESENLTTDNLNLKVYTEERTSILPQTPQNESGDTNPTANTEKERLRSLS